MGISEVGCDKGVKVDMIKDCMVRVENCGVKLVKCSVKMARLPKRKSLLAKERKSGTKFKVKLNQTKQGSSLNCTAMTYTTTSVAARAREKWFYPRHRIFPQMKTQDNEISSSSQFKKFSSPGTIQRLKLIQDKAISSTQSRKSLSSEIQQTENSQMRQSSSMIMMRVEYLKTKENTKRLTKFSIPRKFAVKFVITTPGNCVEDLGRALVCGDGLHYPKVDEVDLMEYEPDDDEDRSGDTKQIVDMREVTDEFCPDELVAAETQVWQEELKIVARSNSCNNKF